jgi:ribosome-interacting GTPase 1
MRQAGDESPDGGEITAGAAGGNKEDVEEAKERGAFLAELYAADFPVFTIQLPPAVTETLRRALYDGLGVLRVYTKSPGKAQATPHLCSQGSTILDGQDV